MAGRGVDTGRIRGLLFRLASVHISIHLYTLRRRVLPNVKSAEKRMRTNRVREQRNKAKRSRLRTAMKQVQAADTAESAETRFGLAKSLLDRAAARRLIHPNKAARLKSQLARLARERGAEAL
jgi:small subunit ribosomal protein S20